MNGSEPFSGETVLITGAGGFIGSALAHSLAASGQTSLILLDSCEQNLFEVHRAMTKFPASRFRAILGSVQDAALLDDIFAAHRPQTVFHAAAHKHVALLESNPLSALQNNVLGTQRVIKAALHHGTGSFLLISTDKAVHPHSIMGVSKRLAERITVSYSRSGCRMNAIRLPNVKGSTGSVLPIFEEQIANGGPVTVTDPATTRYFLSLAETVAAILTAARSPAEGRVLLPVIPPAVKILDLARTLIGNRPSIRIETIGLRPGEKLHEDWLAPGEVPDNAPGLTLTALQTPLWSLAECDLMIENLSSCLASRSLPALLDLLQSLVPDYTPSELLQEAVSISRTSRR